MENKLDIIENNNFILDTLSISKCISRRLKREISIMCQIYQEINVELTQKSNEICVNVHDFGISYKFIIGLNYPFVCPTVFLNNRKYKQILTNKTNYEITYLKKLTGVDCLCCNSLTCSEKWAPNNKLNDIINEIKYFKKIKRDLVFKILTDKIKVKYLNSDIDLISWLF
jgi:hypothetical protein